MSYLSINFVLFISNPFIDRFNEGGPFFMSCILICLLLSLYFIVRGIIGLKDNLVIHKYLRLTSDVSLLGLVIGFLGSVIGLIEAFDSVEALGNPEPALFAGGLKVSLLTATFGLFTFVIARIGILVMRCFSKEQLNK